MGLGAFEREDTEPTGGGWEYFTESKYVTLGAAGEYCNNLAW